MKTLRQYILEASINAKKRDIRFAKSFFNQGKNKGDVKCFGIMTAENPNSQLLSKKENKKRMDNFKNSIKHIRKYIYVTLDGHFGGNVEHSLLIFNITIPELQYYAGKYEQTSFFYCYTTDDYTLVSEYWQKQDTEQPYDEINNPYIFINKTDVYHNEESAEDNFSIIGGDYKYTIDTSVFEQE